jgi:RNA polymerase sigma factor (sigma-70 family)
MRDAGAVMCADFAAVRRRELLSPGVLRLASDERLVEQVRAGSERAFEAIFDRHHRPVLAFCVHMLGTRAEAEDVVQQTFLSAYRDLVRSAEPIALRPWLYGIARHRCLSARRGRRERPVEVVPEPARSYHLTAEVVAREDLRAALADVTRLPDDQRVALVLAELGGLRHEEIARILGCPREKVKALVFQARSSLAAGRAARETPCAEIREQLATLRGAALRHTTLRRHLRDCPGCRAFREAVRVQRRRLALRLPVVPTVGLKRGVLGALFGSGGGGAGGAAVTVGVLSSSGLAAAALVVVAIPVGGVAALVTAARDGGEPARLVAAVVPSGAAAPHPARRATAGRGRIRDVGSAFGGVGDHSSASARTPGPRPAGDGPPGPEATATDERRATSEQAASATGPGQAAATKPPRSATPSTPPSAGDAIEPLKRVPPTRPPSRRSEPATPPQASHRSEPATPPDAESQVEPARPVDHSMPPPDPAPGHTPAPPAATHEPAAAAQPAGSGQAGNGSEGRQDAAA